MRAYGPGTVSATWTTHGVYFVRYCATALSVDPFASQPHAIHGALEAMHLPSQISNGEKELLVLPPELTLLFS